MPHTAPPATPIPWILLFPLVWAILRSQKRSFRNDACTSLQALKRPLLVTGSENIPQAGPGLVVINHFSRPSFLSWWLTLATSSAVPEEIHWIISSAWVFHDPVRSRVVTPASRWAYRKIAQVYSFFRMPPMPPDSKDVNERAKTVRDVLQHVKRFPNSLVGIAPEGRDVPGGVLSRPFPGAGRFLLQLARQGLPFYPVGIFQQTEGLCLNFGPSYCLTVPEGLRPDERDEAASGLVMESISRLLPVDLRGAYPLSSRIGGSACADESDE